MQKTAIYAWATTICERADAKFINEDTHVELKRAWPPAADIARQLAGHANAAHGEPILWLIGVADGKEVCGISDPEDPGAWYEVVRSKIEGAPPDLQAVFVPWRGLQVCALLFETDNPPYLAKNISGTGPFQYDVPWRDGTLTRSARKHELLKLLVPLQKLPEVEVHEVTLTAGRNDDRASVSWLLTMKLYVTPPVGAQVDLPFHKSSFELWVNGRREAVVAFQEHVRMTPRGSYEGSSVPRIASTSTEITISGPGSIEIRCNGRSAQSQDAPERMAQQHIVGRILPANAEIARILECDLLPSQDSQDFSVGRWVYPPHRVTEKTTPDFSVNMPEPLAYPFAPLRRPEGW